MRRVQNFQITWFKQPDPLHAVRKLSTRSTELDLIITTDPFKLAEVGISMARNPNVSRLSDVSSAFDMPDTLIESPVVCPCQHYIGEVQPGHFKSTQHCTPPVPLIIGGESRIGFNNRFLGRLRRL